MHLSKSFVSWLCAEIHMILYSLLNLKNISLVCLRWTIAAQWTSAIDNPIPIWWMHKPFKLWWKRITRLSKKTKGKDKDNKWIPQTQQLLTNNHQLAWNIKMLMLKCFLQSMVRRTKVNNQCMRWTSKFTMMMTTMTNLIMTVRMIRIVIKTMKKPKNLLRKISRRNQYKESTQLHYHSKRLWVILMKISISPKRMTYSTKA